MRKFLAIFLGFLFVSSAVLFAQIPFVQPPAPLLVISAAPNPCTGLVPFRQQIVNKPASTTKTFLLLTRQKIAENINLHNPISMNFALRVIESSLDNGDCQAARKIAFKIIEKKPQEAYTLFLIAGSYAEEKNFVKAIEYYLKAEKINTRIFNLHNYLGYSYWLMDNKNLDKLQKECELEINYYPLNYWAYISRAIVDRGKHDNEAAFQDYAKAVELGPDQLEILLISARFCQQLKIHQEEGMQYLNMALQKNPKSWRVWEIKAGFYYNEGKYQESEEAYLYSLKLNNRSTTLYELSWVYVKIGNLDLARKVYEDAKLLLQPDDPCYEYTARQYLEENGVVLK